MENSFTLNSESHSSTTPRSEPSIFLNDHPLAAWGEEQRGSVRKECRDGERDIDLGQGGGGSRQQLKRDGEKNSWNIRERSKIKQSVLIQLSALDTEKDKVGGFHGKNTNK